MTNLALLIKRRCDSVQVTDVKIRSQAEKLKDSGTIVEGVSICRLR